MNESCKNPNCCECINDCKDYKLDNCENQNQGRPVYEYVQIIKEQQRNLHKICDKHSLKISIMNKMLKGKERLSYKYRYVLETELFESNEWWNWIKDGMKTF